jgi:hypothetical protein
MLRRKLLAEYFSRLAKIEIRDKKTPARCRAFSLRGLPHVKPFEMRSLQIKALFSNLYGR